MDPAEKAFRALRENWFNSHLRSYPHERDGEDESREELRERDNARAKELFDMDTEAILRGEDRPITPRCLADITLGENPVTDKVTGSSYHWERDSDNCISLFDCAENGSARVVGISCNGNVVEFTEQCDNWFCVSMSKRDAIDALKQAIDFIECQCGTPAVIVYPNQVVQRTDGSKYVARKTHNLPEGAKIVADSPHEDGDMSYCCGQDWCGCMQ